MQRSIQDKKRKEKRKKEEGGWIDLEEGSRYRSRLRAIMRQGEGGRGRGQKRSRIWRAFVKRRRSRVATTTQPRSFFFFFLSSPLQNGEPEVMEILERRRASVDQSEEENRYRKGAIQNRWRTIITREMPQGQRLHFKVSPARCGLSQEGNTRNPENICQVSLPPIPLCPR